ncbi:MAG TPA: glycosyltransferase family 39 protein, partial [Caldilineaceae bacterium]|nr:glycosyltransferase family 39 protein [Caldilineaceae bacterium]
MTRPLTPAGRPLLLAALGLALLAQAVILAGAPHLVQASAVLVWAGLVPGWLLMAALVGRSVAPPGWAEAAVYAVGAGYGCLVGMLLLASYLPGPLSPWHLYVAVNGLIAALALWAFRQPEPATGSGSATGLAPDRFRLALGLILLLGVGALLRLPHLGYAEFHGDEARAVLRAAAVIQGYEDVLLLHKKGPAEILTPAAIFAVTGHLTEASARLPFALASLAALVAVWLLGARLDSPLAGWSAAMLLAVDGYFTGFARIVQYQSLVILTSALVMLALARLAAQPLALARYLALAALFFATGLWSHYEGALVALPALYLVGVMLRRHRAAPETARRLWAALGIGGVVAALLLALFYLPFLLHAQFGATYTYLMERRIGGEPLPANHVADFFIRTTTYSSTYYAVFLIGV